MKRFLIIVCLAYLGIFNSIHAGLYVKAETNVALKGKLIGTGPIRNQPQTPPIEAYQNSTSVELAFLVDLGNLNIEVFDETDDIVYQTKVNALAGGSHTINTINWASGEYTLLITDGQGGYLEGVFEIE